MKKIKKPATAAAIILAALVLCVCGCSCTGYGSDTVEADGITYYLSENGGNAFAYEYKWDLDPDNTDIYIPDRVGGATVEKVGGFMGMGVPCPFHLEPGRECISEYTLEPEKYGVPVTWRDVTFTVHIGRYISDVNLVSATGYMGVENEDGGIELYKPVFRFECASDSPYMYSVDGRLYRRRDDSPVIGDDYLPGEGGSGSYVPDVSGSDAPAAGVSLSDAVSSSD